MHEDMKVVIKGIRYNTASSDRVCMIRANTSNEFTRIDAALYRTKIAKRYFLAGEGGSLTVFARRSSAQNASKGAAIIPISEPEARRYAERYGSPKDIKEFFP